MSILRECPNCSHLIKKAVWHDDWECGCGWKVTTWESMGAELEDKLRHGEDTQRLFDAIVKLFHQRLSLPANGPSSLSAGN